MGGLRAPGLGPIVGHMTATSCRLWIRADDPADEGAELDAERRTIGVIAVASKQKVDAAKGDLGVIADAIDTVCYFRLRREFDRTGTFEWGHPEEESIKGKAPKPLQADTEYQAWIGTLTIDDPFRNDENIPSDKLADVLPDPIVWKDALLKLEEKRSVATFRTFPAAEKDQISFVLGSCRYPGLLWKAKQADKIFGPLRDKFDEAEEGGKPRFTLMVGDQVYADKMNAIPLGLADTYEEFQERYLTAFGSGNMRKLLRSQPTYMILDDHEIEDNWKQDRMRDSSKARVFNLAIGAYMSYQWSHSPRNFDRRLFYSFDFGSFPFFVLDTRTQRYMDDVPNNLDDNHMLGKKALHDDDEPGQIDRLLKWLSAAQALRGNIPKFIVTSSVFAPNPMDAREGIGGDVGRRQKEASDSWPAFPKTRKQILKQIIDDEIQNVVFLSGDIHCANVARIHFSGSEKAARLKAFAVTSSAFYWPFPFADGAPSDYVHNSKKDEQLDTFNIEGALNMDYEASHFTQEDNFCRVDVANDGGRSRMVVRMFDNEGKLIENERFDGSKYPLQVTLDLAPW